MNTKNIKKSVSLSLISIAFSTILTACTVSDGNLQNINSNQAFEKLDLQKINYEQIDTLVNEDSRFNALILKTRYYIIKKDLDNALNTIKILKQESKTPLQSDHIILLEASVSYQKNDFEHARKILSTVNKQTLQTQAAIYFYQLYSKSNFALYEQNKDPSLLITAFNSKKELFNLVNEHDKMIVLKQSIDLLKQVSNQDLSYAISRTEDLVDKGYLEFALIDKSDSAKLRDRLLKNWDKTYVEHPLKMYLTNNQILTGNETNITEEGHITKISNLYQLQNKDSIAVLLPLTGRFANNVGKVAKLGILAAIQDRKADINVKFYDTNTQDMKTIIADLENNNIKFIIGPILQPEVNALADTNTKIQTIAFNAPYKKKGNIFYFDLGADYEGKTVAAKIYSDKYTKPAIIAANTQKAKKAIEGFSELWLTTGNSIANVCHFGSIKEASEIATTCDLKGADSVYLLGSAREASSAFTALPKNVSVYVSDSSFEGVNNTGLEMSLVGANISDMPWLLTDSQLKSAFLKEIEEAKPQSQRIFAAAYDAINVAFNIKNIDSNGEDVLHGLSGDIELSNNGLLHRAPMWLKVGQSNSGRF